MPHMRGASVLSDGGVIPNAVELGPSVRAGINPIRIKLSSPSHWMSDFRRQIGINVL